MTQSGVMTRKHSTQREAVYNFLRGRKDHPTADVIYQGVREEIPNISLGTVYRNLMVLRDEGRIRTVDVGDGVVHFDFDVREHDHFVCRKCGCVQDLPARGRECFPTDMFQEFDGQIEGCSVYFYGVCADCLKKRSDKAVRNPRRGPGA